MVKFFALFFCVTQLAWSALPREGDEGAAAASVDFHVEIFKAIMDGEKLKAEEYLDGFNKSLVNVTRTMGALRTGRDQFLGSYQGFENTGNTQLLVNSAIVCGVALVAESARFMWCTDDSWCYWMPPAFAATAGGNFAVAVTQLTDNPYATGVACVVACVVASLQHVNDWKIPGLFNPVAGNLIGFFGRKLLPTHDSLPTLSHYFAKVKPEVRGLLSEYLSTVAFIEGWSKDNKTLLHCSSVAHLCELELRRPPRPTS